jgi:hypothetical protein
MGHVGPVTHDCQVNDIDPVYLVQVAWSRTIALSKALSSDPSLEEQFQILETVELHLHEDKAQQLRVLLLQAELAGRPAAFEHSQVAATLTSSKPLVVASELNTLAERFEISFENTSFIGGLPAGRVLELDVQLHQVEQGYARDGKPRFGEI